MPKYSATPRKNARDALERRYRKHAASLTSPSSKEPLLEATHKESAESDDENTLTAYGDISLTDETLSCGGSLCGSLRPRIPRPQAPSVRGRRRAREELEDFKAMFSYEDSSMYSPLFKDVPPAMDFAGLVDSLKVARRARTENPFSPRENVSSGLKPGNVRLVTKPGVFVSHKSMQDEEEEDTENILGPLLKEEFGLLPAYSSRRPIPTWKDC